MAMQASRRAFLQSAACAGIPLILPSRVWAKGAGVPNMAFIGLGIQSHYLLDNFRNQDVHIVAVCDVDRIRRQDAVNRVDKFYQAHPDRGTPGNCRGYADFRDVLARRDVDLVCIATPDHWHAYITIAALKAGKDVYCEKPLTYNIAEAVAVMKAVKDTGRVLQTGAMQRSSFEFLTAAELVRNGVIGRITHIDCNFGGPSRPHRDYENPKNAAREGAPNPDVDFDMWCGGAPLVKYSDRLAPRGVHKFFPFFWRFDDYFGSGSCGDFGAHHLDIAQWGLGMDEGGPVKIVKSEEKPSDNPFFGGRRQSGVRMLFPGGAELSHNPFSTWAVVFYGTDGAVAVNRGKFAMWHGKAVAPDGDVRRLLANGKFSDGRRVSYYTRRRDGGSMEGAVHRARKEFLENAKVKLYKTKGGHQADFLQCAASRSRPCSNEGVGGHAAILCHLLNMAYVRDVSFDWDPGKFTFANGTGDPKWLAREVYRRGFSV